MTEVVCFLVDIGSFKTFRIDELRVVPELCLYQNHILKLSKLFKNHQFAIRCTLGSNL